MPSKQAEQRRRERQSVHNAIAEANRCGDAAALKPGIEDSRRRLLGGRKKDPNVPSPGLRAMAELVGADGYVLNEVANEQAKENAATLFRAMGHDDHKSALALTFEGTAALLRGAWAITFIQGANWMRHMFADAKLPESPIDQVEGAGEVKEVYAVECGHCHLVTVLTEQAQEAAPVYDCPRCGYEGFPPFEGDDEPNKALVGFLRPKDADDD